MKPLSVQETINALDTGETQPIPMKVTLGNEDLSPTALFSRDVIESGAYVEEKQEWRDWFISRQMQAEGAPELLARIGGSDNLENFFRGERYMRKLHHMDQKGLRQGKISHSPWSASYWPTYGGVIAARYTDPNFPNVEDWQVNHRYYQNTPMSALPKNQLSPSEKYELAVGMNNGRLTRNMWGEGRYYFDKFGKVQKWFGICHGWAPASYMFLRPKKSVTVTTVDGGQVTFLPEDIKALASLLWAHGRFSSKFLGGRCNTEEPIDNGQGRLTEEDCFDNNPGAWHLAIVNQIGIKKENLIMDVMYDHEVWNQPIVSYSYSYFNPQTKQTTSSLRQAAVPVHRFSNDPYRSYRARDTKRVVGIAMDVTYRVTRQPLSHPTDGPGSDVSQQVRYVYDLELDDQGRIIGGEWYQKAHPDFVWTPPINERAMSPGDQAISQDRLWNGQNPVPASWQEAAQSSAQEQMPLGKLVESLFWLSNR